jgi:hypothetical protein
MLYLQLNSWHGVLFLFRIRHWIYGRPKMNILLSLKFKCQFLLSPTQALNRFALHFVCVTALAYQCFVTCRVFVWTPGRIAPASAKANGDPNKSIACNNLVHMLAQFKIWACCTTQLPILDTKRLGRVVICPANHSLPQCHNAHHWEILLLISCQWVYWVLWLDVLDANHYLLTNEWLA